MRTKFADAVQHADAFFVICAISSLQGIFAAVVISLETCYKQGVEPNLNPNRKPEWTVSFWWTQTEPEPAKFYFSEPEPNLNP